MILLISHAFENCVGRCACVSARFVLVNEGQRSHAKCNVQMQVKSAVWPWGDISRSVNGENV